MALRLCPFCEGNYQRKFANRLGTEFVRCVRCCAIYMNINPDAFSVRHAAALRENIVDGIIALEGQQPSVSTWRTISKWVGPGSVLELGPGSGHLLAAARLAGHEVMGIEINPSYRAHIANTWKIATMASVEHLPPSAQFDVVLLRNVLEHIYDVAGVLSSLRSRLRPGGRLFISTVNAQCVASFIARSSWPMLRPIDHVSFPSGQSLREIAKRTEYNVVRVWSGELPGETPISIGIALRDWLREARTTAVPDASHCNAGMPAARSSSRRIMGSVIRAARFVDVTRHITAILGRASTIKAVLTV